MSVLRTTLTTALLATLAVPADAALFVVDTKAVDVGDWNPGDGKCEWIPLGEDQLCTLRAAVQEANALAGADTIIIPDGWHIVLSQPGRDEDNAETGDLDIVENVTIGSFLPPGPEAWPTVDGGGIDRVFHVWGNLPVLSISGLVITGGVAAAPGPRHGGGIFDATGQGLDLTDCRIHHNVAEHEGGGLYAYAGLPAGGTSTIDGCSLEDNRAGFNGTAIFNHGDLLIKNSTVAGNRDLTPGNGRSVIENRGGLTLRNSTLSGNQNTAISSFDAGTAPHGLVLNNVTIVGNAVGLDFQDPDSFSSPHIRNTILAHNSIQDCFIDGGVTNVADNNNLDSDGSCGLNGLGSDLPFTDPRLGPLQLNGGTTRTMAPLYGIHASPAINRGNNLTCESNDQRGATRPFDGTPGAQEGSICDIGAVEALPCPSLAQGWVFLDNEIYGPPSGVTVEACFNIGAGPAVDVLAGGALTLRARELIILSNGFTVHSGGEFTAIRDPAAGSGITLP